MDGSYKIARLNEKTYPKNGSVIPKYFWNNAADFFRNGIGFSLVCPVNRVEVVASIAFSSYLIDNMLEIGIETNVRFRGKGYALIVSSYLIDYCLENGFEPVWSCRLENVASYKAAQKLGFEPTVYLPYYKLNGSPRNVIELKPEPIKLSAYPDCFMTHIASQLAPQAIPEKLQEKKEDSQTSTDSLPLLRSKL